MQSFTDKFQFKNYIAQALSDEINLNKDVFDRIFANLFLEIFEKEQKFPCIFKLNQISIAEQIVWEVKNIKKTNKKDFLLLFEDCQKLNNELNELVISVKKECGHKGYNCNDKRCNIDISRFPLFYRCIEHKDLKVFKPELVTSTGFIKFFEKNAGKYGLYFLYNLRKELIFIGKSTNLGQKLVEAIWDKNVDGYVSVAHTKSKSDIHLYEPYYIIKEKPMLNSDEIEADELTQELAPLEKSGLVKIYENN
jgi:hypothetical protein